MATGHALRHRGDDGHAAFRDDAAALDAGAGPEVDDVVHGSDDIEVVLDDNHGVAAVAELAQQVDQPAGVASVQADRRLVEHAGQTRQP